VLKKGNQNEKCRSCYLDEECMLTTAMAKMCGGPWRDEIERINFIREDILGIKKK
jgi:hypothetical protein